MRKFLSLSVLVLLVFSLCGCGGKKPAKLEFKSLLQEEDRIYYVGDEFDSTVDIEGGKESRIPYVVVLYNDGTRSDDVSHSENIEFSGYDLSKVGKQTVTVKYTENKKTVKAKYDIEVKDREILFIEVEDPDHLNLVPFKVGEKFNTVFKTPDGTKHGVTVRLHMKDPSNPYVSYFADDSEVSSAKFDTSKCKLNENGEFTEAGTFTVSVSFKGFNAEYKITVQE